MSSHHFIFGLVLIVCGAGALVFLLGQSSFVETFKAPLNAVLSGFGIKTEKEAPLSSYGGKVVIDFVSLGADIGGNETYVTLRMKRESGEYINVTGWRIVSSSTDFRIPKARDFQTDSNVMGDIFLRAESVLTIYAGKPEEGENRRVSESEWAVWMNKQFLPFPHGSLILLDREGKKVDQYMY